MSSLGEAELLSVLGRVGSSIEPVKERAQVCVGPAPLLVSTPTPHSRVPTPCLSPLPPEATCSPGCTFTSDRADRQAFFLSSPLG